MKYCKNKNKNDVKPSDKNNSSRDKSNYITYFLFLSCVRTCCYNGYEKQIIKFAPGKLCPIKLLC